MTVEVVTLTCSKALCSHCKVFWKVKLMLLYMMYHKHFLDLTNSLAHSWELP